MGHSPAMDLHRPHEDPPAKTRKRSKPVLYEVGTEDIVRLPDAPAQRGHEGPTLVPGAHNNDAKATLGPRPTNRAIPLPAALAQAAEQPPSASPWGSTSPELARFDVGTTPATPWGAPQQHVECQTAPMSPRYLREQLQKMRTETAAYLQSKPPWQSTSSTDRIEVSLEPTPKPPQPWVQAPAEPDPITLVTPRPTRRWLMVLLCTSLSMGAGFLGTVLLTRMSERPVWVGVDIQLRSGPTASSMYSTLATLPAGSEVRLLAQEEDFVVVRDLMGRVGYLPRWSVVRVRPAVEPTVGFADCTVSPLEANYEACVQRAYSQRDRCTVDCPDTQGSACQALCDGFLATCLRGCRTGTASPAAAPPAAELVTPTADEDSMATSAVAIETQPSYLERSPEGRDNRRQRRLRRLRARRRAPVTPEP